MNMASLASTSTTRIEPAIHPSFPLTQTSVRRQLVQVEPRVCEAFNHCQLKELPLANLNLLDIKIDAATVQRSEEDIERDGIRDFTLTTLIEGEARIQQGDSEFTLKPGELAIIAGDTPYSISYTQHSHRVLVQIPENVFAERILGRKTLAFEARPLISSGLVPIVINLIQSLMFEAEQLGETDQHTLAESLLELSGAVIRASVNQEQARQNKAQAALMQRILTYMDEHFTDCHLTPEKIAEANGISMRYLHRLFQQSGIAVSKSIWERRLKATREDILNPAKCKMRIGEIAFNRGFNDTAHFSRSFRERFGITPTQLRKKAQTPSA